MFKRFGLVLFVLAGVVPAIPAAAADNAAVMVPVNQFVDGFNKGDAKTALARARRRRRSSTSSDSINGRVARIGRVPTPRMTRARESPAASSGSASRGTSTSPATSRTWSYPRPTPTSGTENPCRRPARSGRSS